MPVITDSVTDTINVVGTSESVGTFTAPRNAQYWVRASLTGLHAAAADITVEVYLYTAKSQYLLLTQTTTKTTTSHTEFHFTCEHPFTLAADQILEVRILSTNVNDTAISATAYFADANTDVTLASTIATVTTVARFTIDDGSTSVNAYEGAVCVVYDVDLPQYGVGIIKTYTAAINEIQLLEDLPFTPEVGDVVHILPQYGRGDVSGWDDTKVTSQVSSSGYPEVDIFSVSDGTPLTANNTTPSSMASTTLAVVTDQLNFTLTAGPPDDDALNGAVVVITDQTTATQKCVGLIGDYDGGTKGVVLVADPGVFDFVALDLIEIFAVPVAPPGIIGG